VAPSGWPFASTVPGLMTHLVASLTLDSTRSCVMQGAFLTQGKASSIPTVFSWGGSISPKGFLPSIMLLVVIIVAVAIMIVLVVVVGGGGVSSIIKLSFVIIVQLLRENMDSVRSNQWMRPTAPSVPLKLKAFSMVAACASKAAETLPATSFLMAA
ncbi:hypothetical protein Tco_0689469, partial [Tanacetum coccineum]